MAWKIQTELARFGPHFTARGVPTSRACSRRYCAQVTQANRENFVVVSALLPRHLVHHFQAFYAYCRWSDDLADEVSSTDTALTLLQWWRGELQQMHAGTPRHPVFVALADTVHCFGIPSHLLSDLLTAFEQDQRQTRYATYQDLLGYCQNSANPVGRVLLHFFESTTDQHGTLSDAICTGLQLANFWQDVARDFVKGRVYVPQEDLQRFGVSEADMASGTATPAFRQLIEFEVNRTADLFTRGAGLIPLLPKQFQLDVQLFLRGGEAVLQAIRQQEYDVLSQRPRISTLAKLSLVGKTLMQRHIRH